MFGLKIEGRLGNQMFQYAFALAQQQRLKDDFYIDGYKYFAWNRYFVLNRYFALTHNASLKNLLKKTRFYLAHGFRPPVIDQDHWKTPDWFISQATKSDAVYKGFFQSGQYFSNVQDTVRKQYEVRPKYRINIKDFTRNNKETIVVHIRRGDYLHWGSPEIGYNLSLPDEYYHRCFSQLDTANCNILFLSDDISYAKEKFGVPGALYSEKNSQITDLQLLMQADHLILSNSSFSWWGAYLNQQAQKVLAPEYWLGFKIGKEWPVNIICPGWQTVPVL
jgi:hypothetical protein